MNFGYLKSDAPRLVRILYRIRRRGLILLNDIYREIHWQLPGGKNYFRYNYNDIINAHHWCFIVGCNNSGTSLLQRVLEASGEISTLPYEGQIYTRLFKRAMRKGHERLYTEYIDELRVDEQTSLDVLPRLVHDWTLDLQRPLKRIILEKTPHNVLRMRWLQKAFPGCTFLCLVRNGYAVSAGIVRKGGKSAQRAARHWNLVHEEMLEQLKGIDNYLVVRYEDLCENPAETAARLAKLLNLDGSKLKTSLEEIVYISNLDDAIPKHVTNMNAASIDRLAPEDLDAIWQYAGNMLERLGYKRITRES